MLPSLPPCIHSVNILPCVSHHQSRTSPSPARGCAAWPASRYSRRFTFCSEYMYSIRFHYSIRTRTAVCILYKWQNCRLSDHANGGNRVLFLYCNMHNSTTVVQRRPFAPHQSFFTYCSSNDQSGNEKKKLAHDCSSSQSRCELLDSSEIY